jgi:hypothetical protein
MTAEIATDKIQHRDSYRLETAITETAAETAAETAKRTHHFSTLPVDRLEYRPVRAIAQLLRHLVTIHCPTLYRFVTKFSLTLTNPGPRVYREHKEATAAIQQTSARGTAALQQYCFRRRRWGRSIPFTVPRKSTTPNTLMLPHTVQEIIFFSFVPSVGTGFFFFPDAKLAKGAGFFAKLGMEKVSNSSSLQKNRELMRKVLFAISKSGFWQGFLFPFIPPVSS